MEKKYQVFISSTYVDLQEERQEVMNALLELDCIPSGMELFPATNEDQWDLIKEVIEECDYYVLILGGRYGSMDSAGMGYTEKEYRYALEIKKPIIAFLHKNPEDLPKKKTELKEEGQQKFTDFRNFVQEKMCKYWITPQELGSIVSRSLIKLQKKHPGIGWVKGDMVPSQEASLEILELKKQIEKLEYKLTEARVQAPSGTEGLAQGEDTITVKYSFKSRPKNGSYSDEQNWTGNITTTWNAIFYQVSPQMIDELNERSFSNSINQLISKLGRQLLKDDKDLKGHSLSNFSIFDEDYQTIKVQLRALGLISKSNKSRSVKDNSTYWTLTEYGDNVMNKLRAIQKDD